MFKKTAAFLFIILALFSLCGVFAENLPGDKVTVIVKVAGDAVLEASSAKNVSYSSFRNTNEEKAVESGIREAQNKVRSAILQNVDREAEVEYVYTHVFNGFAMDVYPEDIEKIKALPGVEGVFLSKEGVIRENDEGGTGTGFGAELMHADYMHSLGYTGKGTVIAIMDTGPDVNHEFFSGEISRAKISKSDVAEKIENGLLSTATQTAHITANRVYFNEKFPFVFNYVNKNCDVYDTNDFHGAHVTGIAAGNNGTAPDGSRFVGTAPDAQVLVLCCISGGVVPTAVQIGAMEDAVKLGADVLNASFGIDYGEANVPQEIAINNLFKAGLLYSSAAGNSSRGYCADYYYPLPSDVDYSSGGTPVHFTAATAVANATTLKSWENVCKVIVDGEPVIFLEENDSVSFAESFGGGEYAFEFVGEAKPSDFENVDVNGKIVVALPKNSDDWAYVDKVETSIAAGAVGILFISKDSYPIINIYQASLYDMPTATVSADDADKFINALQKTVFVEPEPKYCIIYRDAVRLSQVTSWCTNSSLELKPEISAPGSNIYSSTNDDQYKSASGTSMAAPHLAGAYALMLQYVNDNPDKFSGIQNKNQFIENLLMSTADVVYQESGTPYSPRQQGAGLVNLKRAAETPVTLIGDKYILDGFEVEKSKISLKEIGDSFNINFTVRNFTNADVTYDSVRMTVITDDLTEDGYVAEKMRTLSFDASLPESITVPAKTDLAVSIPVTLDKTDVDENFSVFVNGFYVDGFVFLENTLDESVPTVNIPFCGFYGDWNSQFVFDRDAFDAEALWGKTFMCADTKRNEDGSSGAKRTEMAGRNLFMPDTRENLFAYGSKDYVGYSPNGDGNADVPAVQIFPLRPPGDIEILVYNSDGEQVYRAFYENEHLPKYFELGVPIPTELANALPDGDYTFVVNSGVSRPDTENFKMRKELEFNFYIDREKPVITKFEITDDNLCRISVTDNRQLMGLVASASFDGVTFTGSVPINGEKEFEFEFPIDGIDEGSLIVEAVDYAQNSAFVFEEDHLYMSYDFSYGSSVVFSAINESNSELSPTVILAQYNKGRLVGLYTKNDPIPVGVSAISFTPKDVPHDCLKLFAWDSLTGMKPLFEQLEIYLK